MYIFTLIEIIKRIAIMTYPIMPDKSLKILRQISFEKKDDMSQESMRLITERGVLVGHGRTVEASEVTKQIRKQRKKDKRKAITVILGLKVHLAFGKTLEADLTEVLVRSVANPRALLTLAFRSLSNGFAS